MVTELKKKGMTMQLLWERYLNENPGGYQYSQFCLHFEHWRDASEVTMHIEYKAGEAMLVDWAGDKLEVINGNTGKPGRWNCSWRFWGPANSPTWRCARASRRLIGSGPTRGL